GLAEIGVAIHVNDAVRARPSIRRTKPRRIYEHSMDALEIIVFEPQEQHRRQRGDRHSDLVVDLESRAAFKVRFRDEDAKIVLELLPLGFRQVTIEADVAFKNLDPLVRKRRRRNTPPASILDPTKKHE